MTKILLQVNWNYIRHGDEVQFWTSSAANEDDAPIITETHFQQNPRMSRKFSRPFKQSTTSDSRKIASSSPSSSNVVNASTVNSATSPGSERIRTSRSRAVPGTAGIAPELNQSSKKSSICQRPEAFNYNVNSGLDDHATLNKLFSHFVFFDSHSPAKDAEMRSNIECYLSTSREPAGASTINDVGSVPTIQTSPVAASNVIPGRGGGTIPTVLLVMGGELNVFEQVCYKSSFETFKQNYYQHC